MILFYKDNKSLKYVEEKNILHDLYFLKARVPTYQDITKYIEESDNKVKDFFKNKDIKKQIKTIKEKISKIDLYVPLYDEYTKNLYLINRSAVYNRVIYQHYRFPNKYLYEYLLNRKKKISIKVKNIQEKDIEKSLGEFKNSNNIHYIKAKTNKLLMREYRKLCLMLDFLNSFDLDILNQTYIYVFYNYSNEVGKDITICKKPSFLPHFVHINPYYKRSELINLALNMNLIKPTNIYYDNEKVMQLCKLIVQNDISSDTILKHQIYMIKENKIGIIQYYSLQGSFFINKYLRNDSEYKNILLEKTIHAIYDLINSSPEFDKSYTLYRFIKSDLHLQHLKVGDIYTSNSFISTTRDPFYKSDIYKFGFILIKIKIPENIKGIALCMETYSHFPEEQEIILAPSCNLRLDSKDENTPYYHTDDLFESKVKTRYEFTYIGKDSFNIPNKELYIDTKTIDFLKIDKTDSITIEERIAYFMKNMLTPYFQYRAKIGTEVYDIIVEWYDSTSVYEKFYAAKTNNGFSMYTINNNHITFFIEIGEDIDGSFMYVNYYFKFSSTNIKKNYTDDDFIIFISSIAYYFEIKNVVIYADYSSCETNKNIENRDLNNGGFQIYYGGNYCVDFYNYFKFNKKRFKTIDSTELKSSFSYYQLNRLVKIDPIKILSKKDRDEIYQIYIKTYKEYVSPDKNNLADFFVWMVDNHCILVEEFIKKMNRLFDIDNPFNKDFYILDSVSFLYNRQMIDEYPLFSSRKYDTDVDNDKDDTNKKHLPKNNYRLEIANLQNNRSRFSNITGTIDI